MSVPLTSVVVRDGDTLEQLVARYLGSTDRLNEVAKLNNLRPPYIVLRAIDAYGPPIIQYTATLTIASTTVILTGQPNLYLIRPYMVAFMDGLIATSSSGQYVSEAHVVDHLDLTTGILYLKDAIVSGGLYNLYICSQDIGATQVLATGGILYMPAANSNLSVVNGDDYRSLYGTDILCSPAGLHVQGMPGGQLALDPNSGDLVLVAGLVNLRQAISHRIQTPLGIDAYMPSYGCSVYQMRGKLQSQEIIDLYANRLRAELLADPRVARVMDVQASAIGDAVYFNVLVAGAGSDQEKVVVQTVLA